MSIDWSKAPSWVIGYALHAFGGEIREVWVGEHQYQRLDQPKPFPYGGGNSDHRYNPRRSEFHFEQLRPTPWYGEGLPPVGTVCEFAGFNPEETLPTDPRVGDQVTVIAHFMSGSFEVAAFTFYAPPEFEYLQVGQGAYGCFRPIRTPEQIAEEARIPVLNLMVGAIKDYPGGRHGVDHMTQLKIHEEACINLYDAGWRKQVES